MTMPAFVTKVVDAVKYEATRPAREVRVEQGIIVLDFRFNGRLHAALLRDVKGVSFDVNGQYRAPLTAALDVDRFCAANEFTGRESLAGYVDRARTLLAASTAEDADVDLPGSFDDLRHYQRASVAYGLAARQAFIADEMGLGKTPVALAAVEARGAYPAVVVCPASLRLNWKREIARWLPGRSVQILSGTRQVRQPVLGGTLGNADITIVNYDVLHAWAAHIAGPFALILDESHYCKAHQRGPVCPTCETKVPRTNGEAVVVQRCKNGHAYIDAAMEYRVRRTRAAKRLADTVPDGGLLLALTGTPITNRTEEFVSQLDILGLLDAFGGQAAFLNRYGDGRNLDELNERLRGIGYIRHRKDDAGVADELPPKLWADRLVEPDAAAMAVYQQAEEDIITFLAERAAAIAKEIGEDPTSAATMAALRAGAAEHLVRFTTLKRLAANTKTSAVREWVESMLDAGEQVVVAAHHRDIVDSVAAQYQAAKIQGGMSVEQVEADKARFQAGDVDVMVLSITAGRTGHTLTAASNIAFVELPWTPGDLDQTSDRLHRIGQTDSVTAWVLLARGTIDEDVYRMIREKRKIVTAATDGREIDVTHDEEAEGSNLADLVEMMARRGLAR